MVAGHIRRGQAAKTGYRTYTYTAVLARPPHKYGESRSKELVAGHIRRGQATKKDCGHIRRVPVIVDRPFGMYTDK